MFPDTRIQVHGIDEKEIGVASGQSAQSVADVLQTFRAEFAPVHGHQDIRKTFAQQGFHCGGERGRRVPDSFTHIKQRVHDRVAGDVDAGFGNAFPAQVVRRRRRGSEMKTGCQRRYTTVQFFGKRLLQIAAAQARFHMAHGNVAVKRAQGRDHDAGGVSLHQHAPRTPFFQEGVHGVEQSSRKSGQTLSPSHEAQFELRRDVEGRKGLRQHLPMLPGGTDAGTQDGGLGHPADHRSHLDGFRARADDDQNVFHAFSVVTRRAVKPRPSARGYKARFNRNFCL